MSTDPRSPSGAFLWSSTPTGDRGGLPRFRGSYAADRGGLDDSLRRGASGRSSRGLPPLSRTSRSIRLRMPEGRTPGDVGFVVRSFGRGTGVRRRRRANRNTRATIIVVASVLTVGIALTAGCGGGNGGLPPAVESVVTGEIPEPPPAPEPPAEPPAEPPSQEPPAAEPPAPEPPAQETQAAQEPPPGPEMSIEPPVLRLTERGDIRVRLACPSKATLCTGTVSLRARGRLLGRSLFAIEGGNTRSARVQLTERGGALLSEEHVDLATVIVVARDTQDGVQGPPQTTRTIVTLLGS